MLELVHSSWTPQFRHQHYGPRMFVTNSLVTHRGRAQSLIPLNHRQEPKQMIKNIAIKTFLQICILASVSVVI